VARLTSIPAQVIPGLAPERGLVKKGFMADLVMVNREKISQVDQVIIGGEVLSLEPSARRDQRH